MPDPTYTAEFFSWVEAFIRLHHPTQTLLRNVTLYGSHRTSWAEKNGMEVVYGASFDDLGAADVRTRE